jgi:hypothetical protein
VSRGFARWIKSSPDAGSSEPNVAGIVRRLNDDAHDLIQTHFPLLAKPDRDTTPEHCLTTRTTLSGAHKSCGALVDCRTAERDDSGRDSAR